MRVDWHEDATPEYKRAFTERYGRPSLWWLRREKDEQEARRGHTDRRGNWVPDDQP